MVFGMGQRTATIAALTDVAPSTTIRVHSDGHFPLLGLRLCAPWASGAAEGKEGPHILSVNEYRPHRLRDVAPIARLSARLVEQLRDGEGEFYGIATAYQPLGRVTYSLSIWTSEKALGRFTGSPLHREVMAQYRTRGYLRHLHWWGEFTTIGAGMAEATRRLDAGEGRRVGEPRDRWSLRDEKRLSAIRVRAAREAPGS